MVRQRLWEVAGDLLCKCVPGNAIECIMQVQTQERSFSRDTRQCSYAVHNLFARRRNMVLVVQVRTSLAPVLASAERVPATSASVSSRGSLLVGTSVGHT
mmetsp:Transcript_37386/g.149204  ORF Transcript_37386/g.149204 Transcript_37386/m.149204 type:complete len:100 (-) Transcript_37386:793-1092(-)